MGSAEGIMDGGAPRWRLWQVPVGVAAVWSARLTLGAIPGLQIGTRQVVFDAYVIAVALVLAASIGQRSPRFFALRRMTITPGRAALWIFLGGMLVGIAEDVYELAFDAHGRIWVTSADPHGAQAVILGLCAVTLVPVAEELFYRGFVHRALRTRLALWPAVGLSSTIFGLAHWVSGDDLGTVVPRIFAGMMLALLLERTGSLYPGIVAHAYFDAGVLGLYVPSVQPLILLVLVLALIVAVAVSVDDDRRKKHGRPGPIARAQAGARERGLQDHVRATGRLGGL